MAEVYGKIETKVDTAIIISVSTTLTFALLFVIKWLYWTKSSLRIRESRRLDKVIVRVWTSSGNLKYRGDTFGHVSLELRINGKPGSLKERTYISVGPGDKLDSTNNVKLYNILSEHPPKYMPSYKDDLKYEERAPELTFQFHTLDAVAMQQKFREHLNGPRRTSWALCGKISIGEASDTKTEIVVNIFSKVITNFIKIFLEFFNITTINDHINVPADQIPSSDNLVSCVSLVNEIMFEGHLSKLVTNKDKIKNTFNGSNLSSKHSCTLMSGHDIITKLTTSLFYFVENGISCFIISPDVFGDLMMVAKENEIKLLQESSLQAEMIECDESDKKLRTKEWIPTNIEQTCFPIHAVTTLFAMIIAVSGFSIYF